MYQDTLDELHTCLNIMNKLCGEFEPHEEDLIRQSMLDKSLVLIEKLKQERE